MSGVLAMILAGGEGTRLQPLTVSRSKPAVPFGGSYRLVDFVFKQFYQLRYAAHLCVNTIQISITPYTSEKGGI